MKLWEAYVIFTVQAGVFLVLSPAVDAARATSGERPLYPLISAILPRGPLLLLVAFLYSLIIAGVLTFGVSLLRRVMPGRSIGLATMLILVPALAFWISRGF